MRLTKSHSHKFNKNILIGAIVFIVVSLAFIIFSFTNDDVVVANADSNTTIDKAFSKSDPAVLSVHYPKFSNKKLNKEVQATIARIKDEQCQDKQNKYYISYESNTVLDDIVSVKFTCFVYSKSSLLKSSSVYTLNYDTAGKQKVSLKTLLNDNALKTVIDEIQKVKQFSVVQDQLQQFIMENDGIVFYPDHTNVGTVKIPYDQVKKDIKLENNYFGNVRRPTFQVKEDPDVDNKKKIIAFTFDDGPSNKNTQRILKAFEKNGGKATFFMVGSQVKKFPKVAKQVYEQGHEIGNHTYTHKRLTIIKPDKIKSEISKTQDIIYSATGGAVPRFMRPPYGAYNKKVTKNVNMPLAMWSVDTNDWKYRNKKKIVKHILKHAKDGSVILLHDLYDTSADAIEEVLPILKEKGFEFVTLSQLHAHRPKATK